MKIKNTFLASYAITATIYINIIGKLMLAELIALLTLPFINIANIYRKYKYFRVFLWCVIFLFVGQVISDFVNESDPTDYLRGWAVIIFSAISTIFFIQMLADKPERISLYLVLFGVASLLKAIISGADVQAFSEDSNYYKANFSIPVGMLITAASYYFYRKKPFLSVLIILSYGLISISLGARSLGLIFITASVLIGLSFSNARLSMPRIILISLVTLPLMYLGYVFYVHQVLEYGFGGANSQIQLSMTSNPYNPFELLYYGRSEFSVLLQAVADRPIFGHGSWAKDVTGVYQDMIAEKLGSITIEEVDFIRAHSVLLGFWAYAGIIGFLSILYLYTSLFKCSIWIYRNGKESKVFPIIVVLALQTLWALFFSPVPVFRTELPIFAALIIVEYQRLQNMMSAKRNSNGAPNA